MGLNMPKTKIELIQWVTTLEDTSTLEDLLEIMDKHSQSKTYELNKQEAQSVNEGIEDMEQGNVAPNSEAKKVYGNCYKINCSKKAFVV